MQCGSCAEKKNCSGSLFKQQKPFLQSIFFGNQSDLRLDLTIIFFHYI